MPRVHVFVFVLIFLLLLLLLLPLPFSKDETLVQVIESFCADIIELVSIIVVMVL